MARESRAGVVVTGTSGSVVGGHGVGTGSVRVRLRARLACHLGAHNLVGCGPQGGESDFFLRTRGERSCPMSSPHNGSATPFQLRPPIFRPNADLEPTTLGV